MSHYPIYFNAGSLNRIGDALCATPYILHLSKKYGSAVVTNGYCPAVRPLIDFENLGVRFTDDIPEGQQSIFLDLHAAFKRCNNIDPSLHFSQGWFSLYNEPVPSIPITLPFQETKSLSVDYAIISPFSMSDHQGNKLWPLERWVEVGKRLLDGYVACIIVIGSAEDDFSVFKDAEFDTVIGAELPLILGALRSARIVLSIDNGISHMCHFGEVSHHLLLQPEILPQAFITNPRGRNIRGWPNSIKVDSVVQVCSDVI